MNPHPPVGAGLLANAVDQSLLYLLIHCIREQARSHKESGYLLAPIKIPDTYIVC